MQNTYGKPALRQIIAEYKDCQKCELLCQSRVNVVFCSGSATADIVIVGESPGVDEDIDGAPFTGKSGRLLFQLLEMVWSGEEIEKIREIEENDEYFRQVRDLVESHIFFTNVVMCRPADDRTPSATEIKNCKERLHRMIYAVDPKLIIAVGGTAAKAVLGKKLAITSKRGEIFDVSVKSPATGADIRYPMMAVLQPSHRDRSLVTQKKGDTFLTMGDLRYALSLLTEYNRISGR